MKILYIAAYSRIDSDSGDSIRLQEEIRHLSKKNEVIVITQFKKGTSIKVGNAEIKRIKVLSFCRDLSIAINTILIGLRFFKSFKPDVIYELLENFGIGWFFGKFFKRPVIIEINGLISDEREIRGIYNPIWNLYHTIADRLSLSMTTIIVAVTPGIKNALCTQYSIQENKIIIIPNGANTDLFRPMDKSTVKKELKLDEQNFYICFVGALFPWQGVEYLIESAPLILEKIPEVKFLIVGDGVTRTKLEEKAKELNVEDKVIFTGSVHYEDVPKYIGASDICVAPFVRARNERIGLSPLKIYEYLACEKPVVASNIKGVGDFLANTNSGISVTPEDATELAKAIVKLLTNKSLREQMGKNGRKIIVENYSWKHIADKVENVCADAVKQIRLSDQQIFIYYILN